MSDRINELALSAAKDNRKREELITQQEQTILRTASKACRKYITKSDDEWSIELIAFYEAVKNYDESKGAFRGFASIVIKRRLMDYFDSESKHKNEIATEPVTFDGDIFRDSKLVINKIETSDYFQLPYEFYATKNRPLYTTNN